jgi:rhodanese-related sulfurtransferase
MVVVYLKMKNIVFKVLILVLIICGTSIIGFTQKISTVKIQYVCSPCGIKCDNETFAGPGQCPDCKMKLVDKKSIRHKSVSPLDLSKFLKSTKNLLVLDVRTNDEFEGHGEPDFGTLKNSMNIPISEIEKGGFKGLDKNKTILVYCSHSHRSSRVSYILTQNGFKNVVNLLGGMSEVIDKAVRK